MGYAGCGARVACSLIGGLCGAQVSLKVRMYRWEEGHLVLYTWTDREEGVTQRLWRTSVLLVIKIKL
jgi:hypothetical protein